MPEFRLLGPLLAASALLACPVPDVVVDAGPDGLPDSGPSEALTLAVGPAGGTVAGPGGASLAVPAGALSSTVQLKLEVVTSGFPALPPGQGGPVWAATPHGTTFAAPVTLTLPFDLSAVPLTLEVYVYKAEPGGAFVSVPYTAEGASLKVTLSSLSFFTVATVEPRLRLPWPQAKPYAVAIDNAGIAHIAGTTDGPIDGKAVGGRDVFLARVDTLAQPMTLREVRVLGTPQEDGLLGAAGVAVTPSGLVYVAFATKGSPTGGMPGAERLAVYAFDATGQPRSGYPVEAIHPRASGRRFTALAVDDAGTVYVLVSVGNLNANLPFTSFLYSWDALGRSRFEPLDVSGELNEGENHFGGGLALGGDGRPVVDVAVSTAGVAAVRTGVVSLVDPLGAVRPGWPVNTTGGARLLSTSRWPLLSFGVPESTGQTRLWQLDANAPAGSMGQMILPPWTTAQADTAFLRTDTRGNLWALGETTAKVGPAQVGGRDIVVMGYRSNGLPREAYPLQFGGSLTDVLVDGASDGTGRLHVLGISDLAAGSAAEREVFLQRLRAN